MSRLPKTPNQQVQEEYDGEWQGHIVEDLSDYGSVCEDAKKDLVKDKGDNSYGVHHFLALVRVAGILNQGDPAEYETDDGQLVAKIDLVPEDVLLDLCLSVPGQLEATSDEEEENQDDLGGRLKSAVDEAGKFGEEAVVLDHLLVL